MTTITIDVFSTKYQCLNVVTCPYRISNSLKNKLTLIYKYSFDLSFAASFDYYFKTKLSN